MTCKEAYASSLGCSDKYSVYSGGIDVWEESEGEVAEVVGNSCTDEVCQLVEGRISGPRSLPLSGESWE